MTNSATQFDALKFGYYIIPNHFPAILDNVVCMHFVILCCKYSRIFVKRPLSKSPKIVFQVQLLLNADQKYCRMLQGEHSAILLTFIKLPFVIKIFVLSIFEWPFYTRFYCTLDPDQNAPLGSIVFASKVKIKIICRQHFQDKKYWQDMGYVFNLFTVLGHHDSLHTGRFLLCIDFFFKLKRKFRNTITMSINLEPDLAQQNVSFNLGLNCLQRLISRTH